MKKKLYIGCLLIWFHLGCGCQTYRPIEKITFPGDPKFSNKENLTRQLAELNEGNQISITLDNGVEHKLIFKDIVGDTVNATFQKPKEEIPIQVSVDRIQEVKVEKVNWPITLLVGGVILVGFSALLSSMTFNYSW